MDELVASQIQYEINRYDVGVTRADNVYGRGLVTTIPRYHGQVICDASALWFSSEKALETFLKDNPQDADRVGRVEGGRMDGAQPGDPQGATSMFFCLVNTAGFANDYHGKKSANARLIYNPSLGFNERGAAAGGA